VGELTGFGLIGFLEALLPELAREAISLGSLEFDGVSSVMDQVAMPVHAFTCRADAETLVGADREITRLEDDSPAESFCDLFIEPFLVSIRLGKPGITVTKLVVRYYCVDAFLGVLRVKSFSLHFRPFKRKHGIFQGTRLDPIGSL
jgi:hypothetical protein